MKKEQLTIIDNFADNLREVRSKVIAGELKDIIGPDGAKYTNVSDFQPEGWHERLAEAVGFDVDVVMSGFRYDFADEMPHNMVHADVICAKYAALVYCNRPHQCSGGTAFWEHIPTGRVSMPESGEIPADDYAEIEADWNLGDPWRQHSFVSMRSNRMAIYPTKMFHCRWPHAGFGNTRHNGRLVWVCFFNRK
jgi:hypothetical protein